MSPNGRMHSMSVGSRPFRKERGKDGAWSIEDGWPELTIALICSQFACQFPLAERLLAKDRNLIRGLLFKCTEAGRGQKSPGTGKC